MVQRLTDIIPASSFGIERAADLIVAGGIVAFPTETVYGLGADATNARAVEEVFAAKGRPSFNPLIVHVASLDAAREIGRFDDTAARLADAFWPGALTLVLPLRRRAGLADAVTAGLDTVALRVPGSEIATRLIAQTGALAGPSANPSGQLSPTTAEAVLEGLSGRIDAVLDGGSTTIGVESTIVGCFHGLTLLRPGGVSEEHIAAVAGTSLERPAQDPKRPVSPGALASHYAPRARLRLDADAAEEGELLLGFGATPNADLNLSPSSDLGEAATNLFAYLRALDTKGGRIAVAPIPSEGVGHAINDRLARAAAPRPGD